MSGKTTGVSGGVGGGYIWASSTAHSCTCRKNTKIQNSRKKYKIVGNIQILSKIYKILDNLGQNMLLFNGKCKILCKKV